ncbi:MAG: ABC transporter ATP-binding protein [Thermodesulfobacteriota bacterium]|nr:ABC transporter ATP-binding protein [Thermodesulfobacteriota bacterium]
MIQLSAVNFSYEKRRILQHLDLDVRQGELLTILGPNGAGKSTLLRLMRGRLRPDSGTIRWQEGAAHQLSRGKMATLAAVVPQLMAQPFGFSVREMVAMGCFAHDSGRWNRWGLGVEQQRTVEQMLAVTDITHLAEQTVGVLSGGELQRVLLARALAQQTPVLLLDEVTSQLDLGHTRSIAELLYRLCRDEGKTIVQVSHDINLAADISQRILMLDSSGAVVAFGEPTQVLSAKNIDAAFGVKVQVEKHHSSDALRVYPLPLRKKKLDR